MSGASAGQPWDSIRNLQREVGRLFESMEPWAGMRFPRPFPAMNLYEAGGEFIITAELPGVASDEIDVSITGETLTLRGERKRPEAVPEESYRRQERPFGRWSRSISLPGRVDGDGITADLARGILTIRLPKAGEAQARPIVVTASPG